MEVLERVWASLSEQQRRLIEDMAIALAGVTPRQSPVYLTVAQIAEKYGKSPSGIYKAMDEDRLPYVTPNGQSKPRYAKESDVLAWLGWA